MRILAIERELPIPAHQNLQDLRHDEAAAVWELMKRGLVRDIWFTPAERRAVLMLECANADEARHHLNLLPLVRGGLSAFTVLELAPYDGFERLFGAALPTVRSRFDEPPEY